MDPLPCPVCDRSVEVRRERGSVVCIDCGAVLDPELAGETSVLGEGGAAPAAPSRTLPDYGPYAIEGEIARGGMGVVYRARHRRLDRVVALKVLHGGAAASQDAIERFAREARSVARLAHPNIVPIHEVDLDGGHPYYTMDLIEGDPLARVIRRGEADLDRAVTWMIEICDGVAYAHRQGVIHRDIKPGNILIDPEGRAHLTDFGLARMADSATQFTRSGTAMGTPNYMPPEQARGDLEEIDEQSDVYALGAVFYELLTGLPPFLSDNEVETVIRVVHEDPTPPRRANGRIPRDLETICLKAMAKDKARRYASVAAMLGDLKAFREGLPIRARPSGRSYRILRWVSRNRGFVAAGVLGVLAAGVVFLLLENNRPLADPPPATPLEGVQLRIREGAYDEAVRLLADLLADSERESYHAPARGLLQEIATGRREAWIAGGDPAAGRTARAAFDLLAGIESGEDRLRARFAVARIAEGLGDVAGMERALDEAWEAWRESGLPGERLDPLYAELADAVGSDDAREEVLRRKGIAAVAIAAQADDAVRFREGMLAVPDRFWDEAFVPEVWTLLRDRLEPLFPGGEAATRLHRLLDAAVAIHEERIGEGDAERGFRRLSRLAGPEGAGIAEVLARLVASQIEWIHGSETDRAARAARIRERAERAREELARMVAGLDRGPHAPYVWEIEYWDLRARFEADPSAVGVPDLFRAFFDETSRLAVKVRDAGPKPEIRDVFPEVREMPEYEGIAWVLDHLDRSDVLARYNRYRQENLRFFRRKMLEFKVRTLQINLLREQGEPEYLAMAGALARRLARDLDGDPVLKESLHAQAMMVLFDTERLRIAQQQLSSFQEILAEVHKELARRWSEGLPQVCAGLQEFIGDTRQMVALTSPPSPLREERLRDCQDLFHALWEEYEGYLETEEIVLWAQFKLAVTLHVRGSWREAKSLWADLAGRYPDTAPGMLSGLYHGDGVSPATIEGRLAEIPHERRNDVLFWLGYYHELVGEVGEAPGYYARSREVGGGEGQAWPAPMALRSARYLEDDRYVPPPSLHQTEQ